MRIGTEVVARVAARALAAAKTPAGKTYAILYLAGFGTRDDLRAVVGYFADDAAVDNWGAAAPPSGWQVRDAALLAAVMLTGQDPKGYGFDPATPGLAGMFGGDNPNPVRYRPTGLEAGRKRDAAFRKWAEWMAKNTTP